MRAVLFGLRFSIFTAQGEPFCDRVLSSGSMAFSKTSKAVFANEEGGELWPEAGASRRSALPLLGGDPGSLFPSGTRVIQVSFYYIFLPVQKDGNKAYFSKAP